MSAHISNLVSCLTKCGYVDGELKNAGNLACLMCMASMRPVIEDPSSFLVPCGISADVGNRLMDNVAVSSTTTATPTTGAMVTSTEAEVTRTTVVAESFTTTKGDTHMGSIGSVFLATMVLTRFF
jgi:hypothetical protein